ncbi:MAG: hypothetical protein ABIF85_01955 [Nanoarchaeota archaeon]
MGMRLTISAIFGLFLIIIFTQMAMASEYSSSTCFKEEINLVNISLDMGGTDRYGPYLVEDNKANYTIVVKTLGNWSQYRGDIKYSSAVYCDDVSYKKRNEYFEVFTILSSNGTVMTDFIITGLFDVPRGKKYCALTLNKIYAINRTWVRENNCYENTDNVECQCWINDLSGNTGGSLMKETFTKEQFFSLRGTEIQSRELELQEQNFRWFVLSVLIAIIPIGQLILEFYKISLEKRTLKNEFALMQMTTKSFNKPQFLLGFVIIIIGLCIILFGLDGLGIRITSPITFAGLFTLFGVTVLLLGMYIIYKSLTNRNLHK